MCTCLWHCSQLIKSCFLWIVLACCITELYSQEDATKNKSAIGKLDGSLKIDSGKIYAVIVGVSDYQDKNMPQLSYADDDARHFYDYLKTVYSGRFDSSRIHLLCNSEARNAKVWELLSNVLAEKLQQGDKVYFYFSGHGAADNAEDFYLLTHETQYVNDPALYTPFTAFGIAAFAPKIKAIIDRGVSFYLIIDACRLGQARQAGTVNYYHDRLKEINGAVQLFACQANQQAKEGPSFGGGRGVFSYCLVNGLSGQADRDGNGDITLREVRQFVENCVTDKTTSLYTGNPSQTPDVSGPLEDVMVHVSKPLGEELLAMNATASKSRNENAKGIASTLLKNPAYIQFNQALASGNLLEPTTNNASFWLDSLLHLTTDEVTGEQLHNALLAALLDKGQGPINYYSQGLLDSIRFNYNYFMDASNYFAGALRYLDKNPTLYNSANASRLFLKARALVHSKSVADWQAGVAAVDSALGIAQWAYLYHTKGLLHFKLHNYDSAKNCQQKAIELAPQWAFPYFSLSDIYKKCPPGISEDILVDPKRGMSVNNCQPLSRALWAHGASLSPDAYPHEALNDTSHVFALIAGVSKFKEKAIPNLLYAADDATLFHDLLLSGNLGDVGNIDSANVALFVNGEATQANLWAQLFKINRHAQKGDIVYIYLSGLGYYEFGEPAFLTYDASFAHSTSNEILEGALNLNALMVNVRNLCNKGVYVFVINDFQLSASLDAKNNKQGNPLQEDLVNYVCISSSEPGQRTYEGKQWGGGHGLFTYYLVSGLYGLADAPDEYGFRDGYVSYNELLHFVSDQVETASWSAITKDAQTPVFSGRHLKLDLSRVNYLQRKKLLGLNAVEPPGLFLFTR